MIDNTIEMNPVSLIKIRKYEISNVPINKDINTVKIRFDTVSQKEIYFNEVSIVNIFCDIKLDANTWSKLLKYNTWQEILDNYDTWDEVLNSMS